MEKITLDSMHTDEVYFSVQVRNMATLKESKIIVYDGIKMWHVNRFAISSTTFEVCSKH